MVAAATEGAAPIPQPGGVSLCSGCSALLVYERDLSVRVATHTERQQLPADARAVIAHAQKVIMMLNRARQVPSPCCGRRACQPVRGTRPIRLRCACGAEFDPGVEEMPS